MSRRMRTSEPLTVGNLNECAARFGVETASSA